MLEQLTNDAVYDYLLIFCRMGGAIMLLPALSESYASPRARIVIALGLSMVITPIAREYLPAMPLSSMHLFLIMTKEILVGVFIGSVAKIILSAMHVAGMIISYQLGIASGMLFDPAQGSQGAIVGTFLTFLTILLIFTTGLHHVFIHGVVDSYSVFPPKEALPMDQFTEMIAQTVSSAFMIGTKIASPQIVVGLVLYLSAGVMGRLMPQMQVFFVMIPVQILLGFFVLMLTLSSILLWFVEYYRETMMMFVVM